MNSSWSNGSGGNCGGNCSGGTAANTTATAGASMNILANLNIDTGEGVGDLVTVGSGLPRGKRRPVPAATTGAATPVAATPAAANSCGNTASSVTLAACNVTIGASLNIDTGDGAADQVTIGLGGVTAANAEQFRRQLRRWLRHQHYGDGGLRRERRPRPEYRRG